MVPPKPGNGRPSPFQRESKFRAWAGHGANILRKVYQHHARLSRPPAQLPRRRRSASPIGRCWPGLTVPAYSNMVAAPGRRSRGISAPVREPGIPAADAHSRNAAGIGIDHATAMPHPRRQHPFSSCEELIELPRLAADRGSPVAIDIGRRIRSASAGIDPCRAGASIGSPPNKGSRP